MAQIAFKLDNGDEVVLSNQVYGKSGPMDRSDASVQLRLIAEHLEYFSADGGVIVFTKHITTARIIE